MLKQFSSLTYTKAKAQDWPAIRALLDEAALPLDGAEAHLNNFLVVRSDNSSIAAVGGFEKYDQFALLRSIAVAKELRGRGVGQELVRRLLKQAKADNITSVVLLTETASDFFLKFGFRAISREQVPLVVQQSLEFIQACPVSALAMQLDLQ